MLPPAKLDAIPNPWINKSKQSMKKFSDHRKSFPIRLLSLSTLLAVGLLSCWTAHADKVIITVRNAAGTQTPPPTYTNWTISAAGVWFNSSGKCNPADGDAPNTPVQFHPGTSGTGVGAFTIKPTLANPGHTYRLDHAGTIATAVASDTTVDISMTGGGTLSTNRTLAFSKLNGPYNSPNGWTNICFITNAPASPEITFTYSATKMDGSAQPEATPTTRFFACAFRFTDVEDLCVQTPAPGEVYGGLSTGQTAVQVPGIVTNATAVTVYADGAQIGLLNSGVVPGVNTVTVSPLVKGRKIVATQTRSGIESCRPSPATAGPAVGGGANPPAGIKVSALFKQVAGLTGPIGASATGVTQGDVNQYHKPATNTIGGGYAVAPDPAILLTPSTCWQTITINPSDPEAIFTTGATLPDASQFAVFTGLGFSFPAPSDDSGPYEIYIDSIYNGGTLIEDFEGVTNETERVLFGYPSLAGILGNDSINAPNISRVSNRYADSGSNSCLFSFQFKSMAANAWQRAVAGGTTHPWPMVDKTLPLTIRLLLLPVGGSAHNLGVVGNVTNSSTWGTQTNVLGVPVTGVGPYTYSWTWSGGALPNPTSNPTYVIDGYGNGQSVSDSGTYTVAVSDGTCTTTRSLQLVVNNPTPTITNLSVGTNIYVGENATFEVRASGNLPSGYPLSYQWVFNFNWLTDETNALLSVTNAQLEQSGAYSVMVNNPYGQTTSGDIVLTVMPPLPIITNQPVDKLVAPGSPASFTVGARAPAASGYPLRYQWQLGGIDLPDKTSATLTLPGAQAIDAGYYSVIVANDFGTTTSSVVALNVSAGIIGSGTGLVGKYYNDGSYTNDTPPSLFANPPVLNRVDPQVNFDWLMGSPSSLVHTDYFSVRWMGQIEAPLADTYSFFTRSDDGVRLLINGQVLIQEWRPQAPISFTNTIALAAGKHDLVYEYYEKQGGAVAELNWFSSTLLPGIVPASQLYPIVASPRLGLQAFGTSLVFNWNYPYNLQSSTNVTGPWSLVTGATSPYTNVIGSEPKKFFRLWLQ